MSTFIIEQTKIYTIELSDSESDFENAISQIIDLDNSTDPFYKTPNLELESVDYYRLNSLLDLTRQQHFDF